MTEDAASDGVVVLRCQQLSAADVASMAESIERAAAQTGGGVIVDCSQVSKATAPGLLALVAWASRSSPRSRGVVLAGARGAFLLAVCQASLQIDVDCYGSVDAARAALGGLACVH